MPRIRYFLPDARDYVDPGYDFDREVGSSGHDRHYAHEVFGERVHDGILLSKGLVGKFPQAQRRRLFAEGVRAFYRLTGGTLTMGDCGSFSYIDEEAPPFSVGEVIEFYESCRFDLGISVDHVITDYRPDEDVEASVRQRQALTIDLASEFWRASAGARFHPIGVAQGWSPRSYAYAAEMLQNIGYEYIAIGGVAGLKTSALLDVLTAVATVRRSNTRIHLLGIARADHLGTFRACGVASIDSTSPIRQAWKDRRHNYHTATGTFAALRVPQVHGNLRLMARINAGEINRHAALACERECLRILADFDRGRATVGATLRAMVDYEALHSPTDSRMEAYGQTLQASPWKRCPCEVCRRLGHHVILFRGAQRNRRRGFHNVWVLYNKVRCAVQ